MIILIINKKYKFSRMLQSLGRKSGKLWPIFYSKKFNLIERGGIFGEKVKIV